MSDAFVPEFPAADAPTMEWDAWGVAEFRRHLSPQVTTLLQQALGVSAEQSPPPAEADAALTVQDERPPVNWWVLGGGAAFAALSLGVGLGEFLECCDRKPRPEPQIADGAIAAAAPRHEDRGVVFLEAGY